MFPLPLLAPNVDCKYLEVDRDDQLWKYDKSTKRLTNREKTSNWGTTLNSYEWTIEDPGDEGFISVDFDDELWISRESTSLGSSESKQLENKGFGFKWTPHNNDNAGIEEFEWRFPSDGTTDYIEIDRDVQLWRFKLGTDGKETMELENKYLLENSGNWEFKNYRWTVPENNQNGCVERVSVNDTSKYTLFNTRKYPLCWYILGVLTHTTTLNRHCGGDETMK